MPPWKRNPAKVELENWIILQVQKAESMLPFILVPFKQFRFNLLKANFSVKYESSRSSSYSDECLLNFQLGVLPSFIKTQFLLQQQN